VKRRKSSNGGGGEDANQFARKNPVWGGRQVGRPVGGGRSLGNPHALGGHLGQRWLPKKGNPSQKGKGVGLGRRVSTNKNDSEGKLKPIIIQG